MSSFDENEAFEAAVPLSRRAMAARPAPYLDDLNPAQRAAVETLDGPVLMLAGAGTGKTKALTARIVHLLTTGRARPNEILAVTFTNKAAREMKERVARMIGFDLQDRLWHSDFSSAYPWFGGFHSLSSKILRRHAELAGLKSNFTILDTDDQLRLLKQLITAANIDEKRWPARLLAGLIDGWKNRALTPARVPSAEAGAYDNRGTELYAQYQDRLRSLNAVDFGDLLLHVVTIFQAHPDVLAQYQRWFRYILVDEYQDTNVAQYLWLRLLAQAHHNICCVGDDDQSIYGWRGAEVGNILRFEADFPGARVIRLEQNYRSTPHILAAASGVISRNENRLGKELWTDTTKGNKVKQIGHWDGEEEARWIGEKIEDHSSGRSEEAKNRYNPRLVSFEQELDRRSKAGLGPIEQHEFIKEALESGRVYRDAKTYNLVTNLLQNDPKAANMLGALRYYSVNRFSHDEIAILVRASHQMRAFEDRFLTIGLPYRVIGGPRFYERLEVRDAMAYFRLAVSPEDDLAFERVVNTPKRGLGDKAQQSVQMLARANGLSLLEGARMLLAGGGLAGKGAGQLRAFVQGIDRWHAATQRPGQSHIELAEQILDESGYTGMWQQDKTPDAPGRLENLKELVKALEQFENLQGFLEHVALIMDNSTEDAAEKVSIMTLHAAKGLEFPVVFLPGWEDGLFPSQRSMDESGRKGLEEERRLAYVGITRAEELATVSFAANRRVYGQWQSALPSRFIDELPPAHVEVLTPPGLYGGGYGAAGMASTIETRAMKADVYNSPGWKRMQERAASRPVSQPRETRDMVINATALSSFAMGDRAFHDKFGYGTVVGIEGDKLDIAFDKAGIKKIVARFLRSAEAAGDQRF
jgi:DNA helicase-2/ATP-dependent DNA helicase PcrA